MQPVQSQRVTKVRAAKTAWCLKCLRILYNTYEQYQYMVKDQALMQEE